MTPDLPPGPLMLDLAGLTLADDERRLICHPQVGGVILFARNIQSPTQVRDLCADLRAARPGLLLAVDQEGGRVQRLRDGFTRLPPLAALGTLYQRDPQGARTLARECGWLMAVEVLACGLDFSFAPVLDLFDMASRVIQDRAFAADPSVVAELGRAYIDGMHEAGMAATGKHFPGHGTVAEDSHLELPQDARSLEVLKARDLVPFAACADCLDAIMPAHVIYPAVDSVCAGFSQRWLQEILRGELGFDGVIFSDDLSMAAAHVQGDVTQRAAAALAAGCDMILVCNDRPAATAVLTWLDRWGGVPSARLPRMRGRGQLTHEQLSDHPRWQAARIAIDTQLA